MISAQKNLVRPETRYEKIEGTEPVNVSVTTEIFAVGSLFYEISTGKRPYDDIEDEEVERLFRQGIFPETADVYIGDIIRKCWIGDFKSVAEIRHAVNAVAIVSLPRSQQN